MASGRVGVERLQPLPVGGRVRPVEFRVRRIEPGQSLLHHAGGQNPPPHVHPDMRIVVVVFVREDIVPAVENLRRHRDDRFAAPGHAHEKVGHLPLQHQPVVEDHVRPAQGHHVVARRLVKVRIDALPDQTAHLRLVARHVPDDVGDHADRRHHRVPFGIGGGGTGEEDEREKRGHHRGEPAARPGARRRINTGAAGRVAFRVDSFHGGWMFHSDSSSCM